MDGWKQKLLISVSKVFDQLILVPVFLFAASVESTQFNALSFAEFLEMRLKVENFLLFLGLLCLWHLIFAGCGLYRDLHWARRRVGVERLLTAQLAAAWVTWVFARLFDVSLITPLFTAVFFSVGAGVLVLSRLALRGGLAHARGSRQGLQHLLIAGTNPRAIEMARRIESSRDLGYVFIGFIDEDWPGAHLARSSGFEIVADFNHLAGYLRDQVVDEIIIALPLKSMYSRAAAIFSASVQQGIVFRLSTDVFTSPQKRLKGNYFGDLPVVSFYPGVLPGVAPAVKRGLDILAALLLLAAGAPLMAVIAILVKLDSRGPVLFMQERVGRNKRCFRMVKFRTMAVGAEALQAGLEELNEADGPVFKIRRDPRITRLGRFLRKTSLDELPQLVNVLCGHMSLVGPRPLPLRDYQGFDQDWHRRRLSVRPGITCLWQVSGRSALSFEQWMRLDMEYIDRWSLWLDVQILARTIPAVLMGKGAA